MLIDGELVAARSGAHFPDIDPTSEAALVQIADGGLEDLDAAVAAARRAFDETDWSSDHAFRRRCLEQLSAAALDAEEEFVRIDTAELGRPAGFAAVANRMDIPRIAEMAALAESYAYERPLADGAALLQREGVGVVGAILTWNCAFMLWTTKVVPALAAGNTVVVRPAPEAPWSSTFFARLIAEKTDIPAGVVNVVTSSDPAVAIALTEDPRVDMITFTGSSRVGRSIMAQAAGTVKKVLLELGGKSANIVLEDGDMQAAVANSVGLICVTSGQACGALTRLLLPRSRYAEGVELAAQMMSATTIGDPAEPTTGQGPQVSAAHRDRILDMISQAQKDGARVVVGGGAPDLPYGYYVQPTLLADVTPDCAIAQEEVFGPVLVAIPYDDEDDAVRIANNSIYGLFGGVFSQDVDRAVAVARRLRTGSVTVNGAPVYGLAPFGGYKQSGIGREMGVWGFEEFLEAKGIGIPAADAAHT